MTSPLVEALKEIRLSEGHEGEEGPLPGYHNQVGLVHTRHGDYEVVQTPEYKACRGSKYNYRLDMKTGEFFRWGNTPEEDPEFAPAGPEILDLEVSTNGCPNACPFCYKGNTAEKPTNMTLDTFKDIFRRFPPTLTSIAFGITGVETNPDLLPMMRHALANGVKPNLTLSGIDLTPERAKDLAEVCGGIAVSLYEKDKETGYNAVKMLVDAGMQQVTVHLMVSKQTLPFTRGVLADYQAGEPRLQGITAFVFLSLKPKGRAAGTFDILPASTFSRLTRECLAKNIPFGFDSCSAPRFERALQYTVPVKVREQLMMTCESCESGLFSSYVSADGTYYPCSFAEGVEGIQGIKVQDHESFLSIWYHPEVLAWRENLLANRTKAGTRYCQIYKEIN